MCRYLQKIEKNVIQSRRFRIKNQIQLASFCKRRNSVSNSYTSRQILWRTFLQVKCTQWRYKKSTRNARKYSRKTVLFLSQILVSYSNKSRWCLNGVFFCSFAHFGGCVCCNNNNIYIKLSKVLYVAGQMWGLVWQSRIRKVAYIPHPSDPQRPLQRLHVMTPNFMLVNNTHQ